MGVAGTESPISPFLLGMADGRGWMVWFGPRAVTAVGFRMGPIQAGLKASDDGRNSNRGKPVVQYPTTPVRNKNSHLGKGGIPSGCLRTQTYPWLASDKAGIVLNSACSSKTNRIGAQHLGVETTLTLQAC